MKEADSFLKNEAVRKYLHEEEVAEALSSGGIVRTRWVLTWKLVPPEKKDQALKDHHSSPATVTTPKGKKEQSRCTTRHKALGIGHDRSS